MKSFVHKLISPENLVILIKRAKSLGWRIGMMVAAIVVDFALQNLGLFQLNDTLTVVLGLVLGEVSKMLNTKKAELPA